MLKKMVCLFCLVYCIHYVWYIVYFLSANLVRDVKGDDLDMFLRPLFMVGYTTTGQRVDYRSMKAGALLLDLIRGKTVKINVLWLPGETQSGLFCDDVVCLQLAHKGWSCNHWLAHWLFTKIKIFLCST